MATSIQVIGDRAESVNDLDLIALICLLEQEVESSPNVYETVAPLVARWQRDLANYGPGVIDLNLDGLVSSLNARAELVALLKAVDEKIRSSKKPVPASVLNARCSAPGITFHDYPLTNLTAAIGRLQALLGE